MGNVCWPLALQLEHNESRVVTGSEQIQLRVCRERPEAIIVATEVLLQQI